VTRFFIFLLTLLFSLSGPAMAEYSDFGQNFNAARTELTVIGHLKPPTGPGYDEVARFFGANYLKPSASVNGVRPIILIF
jgi:hypothetical protein